MRGYLNGASCLRTSLLDALTLNWRLDLRDLYEYRRTYLRIGSQGCCTARIGATIVTSSVSAEVVEPKSSRPSEGIVHFNLNFSAPVTVSDDVTRPQEYVNEIKSLLRDSIMQSGCVDLESLCIISGDKVWKIIVNLSVLATDGNVLDCASIATVSSLADFSLPAVSVEGKCIRVWNELDKNPVPLVMNHLPLFNTFCLFNNGKTIICDPGEAEERLAESKLYIAVNSRQELCALKSASKKHIFPQQLHQCISLAEKRVKELTIIVNSKLEEAKLNRKKGNTSGDSETFDAIFDFGFDAPWKRLIKNTDQIDEGKTDGTWKMETEGASFDEDDDEDAEPSRSQTKVDTTDDVVTVEHSEFTS